MNGANGTEGSVDGPGRSIVVVDDDIVVHMTLTIALPGTTVIEATRRRAGFDCIRTMQPDAVVIDRRMPDGDGLALVRKVRSEPTTSDIPVVVLTAGFDEADRPEVMEAGADAYLGKPFDPEALLAVVEGLIGARPPRPPRPATAPRRSIDGPAETNGRPHRRTPLRAASRATATATGLPAPGRRQEVVSPLLAAAPAKIAVDAVALGAAVARAELRAEAAESAVAALQGELDEARDDNARLKAFVDTMEAKLAILEMAPAAPSAPAPDGRDLSDAIAAVRGALAEAEQEARDLREQLVEARQEAAEVDQLRRELSRAYTEIEILEQRADVGRSPGAAPRLTRKRTPRTT